MSEERPLPLRGDAAQGGIVRTLLALSIAAATFGPGPNGEPAREPQLAANGSVVALVYGAGHSIFFARSTDGGTHFDPAVLVSEGAIVPLNRHRGPHLAFAGSTIVVTAVIGNTAAEGPHAHGLPSDGNLISWRSLDGGKTWSHGAPVNDAPDASTEGLHGLAAGSGGRLFAVWLDKRDKTTELYGALSLDAGKTWSKNVLVYASPDATICECCHPSVVFDHDGGILVMFRNWLEGSRDLYLTRSTDGVQFSPAHKLGTGTWKLNACPMDGGGIADSEAGVVTAWRRERSIFLARPGAPEIKIGEGTDVAITAGSGGVYTIWSTPESIEILTPVETKPVAVGSKGAFPAITALPVGGAVAAWESEGKIVVKHLR